MKIRVGINGLGRIGKKIVSLISDSDRFTISAINDINPDCILVLYFKLRYHL